MGTIYAKVFGRFHEGMENKLSSNLRRNVWKCFQRSYLKKKFRKFRKKSRQAFLDKPSYESARNSGWNPKKKFLKTFPRRNVRKNNWHFCHYRKDLRRTNGRMLRRISEGKLKEILEKKLVWILISIHKLIGWNDHEQIKTPIVLNTYYQNFIHMLIISFKSCFIFQDCWT